MALSGLVKISVGGAPVMGPYVDYPRMACRIENGRQIVVSLNGRVNHEEGVDRLLQQNRQY